MRVKSSSISKKASQAQNLLQVLADQRRDGSRGRALPTVISFDEMWSSIGARRGEKRRGCCVWTSLVEEPDRRKWVDFEVGDR